METSRLLNYDTKKSEYTVVIPQDTSFKNYLEKENYLSDFITLEERNKVLENLGLDTNLQERLSTVEGDIGSLSSDIYKINTNISNIDINIEEIRRLLGLEEGEGEEGEEDENSLTTIINNAISKYLTDHNIGSKIAIDDDNKSFTSNNVTYTLSLNEDNKLGFSTYTPVTASIKLNGNLVSTPRSYHHNGSVPNDSILTASLNKGSGTYDYYWEINNTDDYHNNPLDISNLAEESTITLYYRDDTTQEYKSTSIKIKFNLYYVYWWITDQYQSDATIPDNAAYTEMSKNSFNIKYAYSGNKVNYFAIPKENWNIAGVTSGGFNYSCKKIKEQEYDGIDYCIYQIGNERGVDSSTWTINIT